MEDSGRLGTGFNEVTTSELKESIIENSLDCPEEKDKIMWLSCHCHLPLTYSPIYPTERGFDWISLAIS